jgi:AraC family transcriptional activator of pobA
MINSAPYRIGSVSEVHQLLGLPKPHHPLIGMIELQGFKADPGISSVVFDMYVISLKRGCDN